MLLSISLAHFLLYYFEGKTEEKEEDPKEIVIN